MLIQNSSAVRFVVMIFISCLAFAVESAVLKRRLRHYYYDTKCLRPVGEDNGFGVELVECSDYSAEQLIKPIDFEHIQKGAGYIQFDLGSKCVTLDGVANDDGVLILIWDCVDQDNQKWSMINRNRDGAFQLQLKQSGKCLAVQGAGKYLDQWYCFGEANKNQWWIVDTVTPGKYLQLENVNRPDHCLSSASAASTLELSPCDPDDSDLIVALTENAGSVYTTLQFTSSRSCLSVPDELNGTLVTQINCVADQANQNWRMENFQNDGSFRIRNKKSFNKCLTNTKGETSMNMYTCTDISSAPQQYWKQRIPHAFGVDQPNMKPPRTEIFKGRLRNYAFNKCVCAVGQYNYAELELVQCSDANQELTLVVESFYNMSKEAAYIQFDVSRKCVSLRGFDGGAAVAAVNGIPAVIYDCNYKDSQMWKIINGNYEGSFQLQLKQTGQCLTAQNDGAYLDQWNCLEKEVAPQQSWTLDVIAKLI